MDYLSPEWFGELLKKRRKECGLSSRQAAELAGISQTYILEIEREGKFTPHLVKKLSDIYDIPYELIEFVQMYYHRPKGIERFKYFQLLRTGAANGSNSKRPN